MSIPRLVCALLSVFPIPERILENRLALRAGMLRTPRRRGQFRRSVILSALRSGWLSVMVFVIGSDLRRKHPPPWLIYPRLQPVTLLCQVCHLTYRAAAAYIATAWNTPTHIAPWIHP